MTHEHSPLEEGVARVRAFHKDFDLDAPLPTEGRPRSGPSFWTDAKRKVILTDVDGTVLNMDTAFERFMAEQGYPALSRMREHYSIARAFGITEHDASHAVREFFRHPLMATLDPEPCAAKVLPDLYRDGWRFVAITAAPNDPKVIAARRSNLEEAFGFEWDAVHCVGLHGEKRTTLLAYKPSVWVEDHFINGVVGAETGHRVFLLDRPYSRDRSHPEVIRVPDWHAIAASIG